MTPEDVPGPIVIESLFPWLAALEPMAATSPHPVRDTQPARPERNGPALGSRRTPVSA